MTALRLSRGDWTLVGAGAALLALAYPPLHLLVPSFVCLIPPVWLIAAGQTDPRPRRRHLTQGFWYGMLANGLVLYWMVIALWRFTWLSSLAYGATIVALGMFHAALFATIGGVTRRTGVPLLVTVPVFWTALEWGVGHLGDLRFPWLGLGTSLTGYPLLVQLADVVGARGITLLLALANTALALAWLRRNQRRRAVTLAGAVLGGIALALAYGAVRARAVPLRAVGRITAVQPNVGYRDKWERAAQDSIVNALVELSLEATAATDPDLVVWPEAAIPYYFDFRPAWDSLIATHARRDAVPLVVGGLHLESRSGDDYDYYNSAFLFDSSGSKDSQPIYHKRFLVPIVERVPFLNPRWFKLRWFGGFGVGDPGPVYRVAIGRFGVLICYESAFESLTRDYRRRGADFIVNITNDAWFGRTSAPYQHAAHLVMRAIENRVGIARAANSGISEFVDPLGRSAHQTGLYVKTFVSHRLLTSDVRTVYSRWGDWVGALVVASAVVLLAYGLWRRT